MIWLSFDNWTNSSGIFFTKKRLYLHGFKWTPIVTIKKRYSTWFGYFKKKSIKKSTIVKGYQGHPGCPSSYDLVKKKEVRYGN